MREHQQTHYVLRARCRDRKGIVAAVAGFLAQNDASIIESHQFNDDAEQQFFMRTAFRADTPAMPDLDGLNAAFKSVAEAFDMDWSLADGTARPRLVIAVSKFGHCLQDLFHRWMSGTLHAEIAAVVSNHDDLRGFVEWSGVPFHHLPVSTKNREEQEARFLEIVEESDASLVVLARYMQILSSGMAERLAGRCINIHHSFLPGFKGAKPYHQAYERGVKIIGATAHYVTSDLDEGPIVEQAVERVNHANSPEELIDIGRDIECRVLARAVSWHLDQRVMLNGRRTVVFA